MKKKMFKTHTIEASNLMPDDRFRMGGRLYRIHSVTKHGNCSTLVQFYPLNDLPVAVIQSMHVTRNTSFKIYYK